MRSTIVSAIIMIAVILALILTGHLNILLAVFMIGVIICFHEFGHFLIARMNGVTVKEFSIGMGPRILSRKIRGTRWSLKLFLFGGSCLMLGDEDSLMANQVDAEEENKEKTPEQENAESEDSEESGEAHAETGKTEAEEGTSFASKNV